MEVHYEGYELEKELGRGATAKIFLARHRSTGECVSLKIFHPRIFNDPYTLQRVRREMELTTRLDHSRIVRVREILDQSDPPALVMDYVDGENLERFQARLPYVLPEISALVVIEILEALEYAHAGGLIHRDLKPENILVGKDGRIFLTDFGLAKVMGSTMITQTNGLLGSLDYMSPEQARGDSLGPVSDLFSVASILYFLTTGTRPFSRASAMATLVAIREEEPEPPQNRNPKLSRELSVIIQRGLAKDPLARFASAREFREVLCRYLESLGLSRAVFDFAAWSQNVSVITLEALKISAHRLTMRCEQALHERDWNGFLELLAHLSLKAPESPALPRLIKEHRKAMQQRKGRYAVILAITAAVVLVIALGLRWKRHMPSAAPAAQPVAQNVPPHAETLTPVALPADTAASRVKASRPATGVVHFRVSPDIAVFWDGRRVGTAEPLRNQTPGKHLVLFEQAGRRAHPGRGPGAIHGAHRDQREVKGCI